MDMSVQDPAEDAALYVGSRKHWGKINFIYESLYIEVFYDHFVNNYFN